MSDRGQSTPLTSDEPAASIDTERELVRAASSSTSHEELSAIAEAHSYAGLTIVGGLVACQCGWTATARARPRAQHAAHLVEQVHPQPAPETTDLDL